DSVSCTYSSGQSITVGDSTQWNQIYGQVFAGAFPLDLGSVMIFSLDTSLNYFPFFDVCQVDSFGLYYFPMVPLGSYYVQATPVLPVGYLPTYYGDVLNWEEATLIILGEPTNPYNIHLLPAESYSPGNGAIHGQINTGALKSGFVDKITMLLMNEEGQAISFYSVDEEGGFDFPELDYGTYYLHAELAGCQSDNVQVELTSDHPEADIVMTFTGNHILGLEENGATMEAGVVYPNPVSDQARISITLSEGSQLHVELISVSGQRLLERVEHLDAGTTTISIPVQHLRDGFYTLHIYTNSGLNLTRKLLKSH
ncbi:MAG: T9SS type A sorting domain-containing protein, partial [Bacteroidales bacterium]|nr:T9SS type A sorting domain-containing protein [Bacteroidales bacterium]